MIFIVNLICYKCKRGFLYKQHLNVFVQKLYLMIWCKKSLLWQVSFSLSPNVFVAFGYSMHVRLNYVQSILVCGDSSNFNWDFKTTTNIEIDYGLYVYK